MSKVNLSERVKDNKESIYEEIERKNVKILNDANLVLGIRHFSPELLSSLYKIKRKINSIDKMLFLKLLFECLTDPFVSDENFSDSLLAKIIIKKSEDK